VYTKRGKASTSGLRGRTGFLSMSCSPLTSELIVGKPVEMGFTSKEIKKNITFSCQTKTSMIRYVPLGEKELDLLVDFPEVSVTFY
jgi:hypothetical protein